MDCPELSSASHSTANTAQGDVFGMLCEHGSVIFRDHGNLYMGPVDNSRTVIQNSACSCHTQESKLCKAMYNLTCQLKRIYQTEGKWMRQLPWLVEQPIENYYLDLNLELLDSTGRKRLARLCQLQDILRDEPKCLVTPAETILLSGPSGSGKTTLLRKMASLWASDASPKLNKFKVLFIYYLKDFRDSEDLGEAITSKLQHFYQESSFVSLDIWLQEVKDNMLLCLDGYDELSENGKANFGRILQNDSPFFSSTIIVTTRLCHDLELNKRFVKHVTVLCLTEKSLNEGIDTFFGEDKQSQQRIKKSVLTNSGCTELFRTSPLVMYSLCYVFQTKEIADITKLTDLCFHVVTMLMKRAAMEEGNNLTEEEIVNVLNWLGEISAEQLFKGKPIFRLADLEPLYPKKLNVILRSGLFLQKEHLDQELEMLHSIFIESLAVRFWNDKSPQFSDRKCVILNELLCKQNCFKSWLLITRSNEIFLAFQLAGMYMFLKHGGFPSECFLETEYDFALLENKCAWRSSVRVTKGYILGLVEKSESTDLLEAFLSLLSVTDVYFFSERASDFMDNIYLKTAYCVLLTLFYLLDKDLSMILSVFRFGISFLANHFAVTSLKDEKCIFVGFGAIFLSSSPYLVISTVLFRYGRDQPILSTCADAFFYTWLFLFYSSTSAFTIAVPIASLTLQKTRTMLSATLLTTSLMAKQFSAYLFLPLSFVTCFTSFCTRDFGARGNLPFKIWNYALPGAIVCLAGISIRQCFIKCLEYYR